MEALNNVLKDPSTPRWAAELIKTALKQDPVEAANVLEVISKLFSDRCDQLLKGLES